MAEKKKDFYDILKSFAEKTENLIDKQVEKLEKKGVLDNIEKKIDKAGDFVGEKINQFKKGDVPNKVDKFVDKTDKKAREVIERSQETGEKITEKVEGFIDGIKARTNQKPNENK